MEGGGCCFFCFCIEELEGRREVDSQAENDAAEHPRQADRQAGRQASRQRGESAGKEQPGPMQEAAPPSVRA